MMNSQILKFVKQIERLPDAYIQGIGVFLVALIGILDYFIKVELSLSIFYLLPIILVTWFINGKIGFWLSGLSAITWLIGYVYGESYEYAWLPYWNSLVRLGFFVMITYLLDKLKNAYEYEKKLARIDPLTEAINHRFFLTLLELERQRFKRYHRPFSLAYFDVDHFKRVNDQLGHQAGNQLLCLITKTVEQDLRSTDILARLGGDEFVILFAETDYPNAQEVVERIYNSLTQAIKKALFPVSFSFGVITFLSLPPSLDQIIDLADQLMYEVKQSGKNGIKYQLYQNQIEIE